MALVFHSGFESGNTFEWSSVTGTPKIQSTTKKTGSYAMRCDTTAGITYVSNGLTSKAITFYLYIISNPATNIYILGVDNGNGVVLNTDRTLSVNSATGTKRITGTTVVAINTWYRVSVSNSSATPSVKLFLNDIQEGNTYGTAMTFAGNLGVITSSITFSLFLYFDDYASDDADQTATLGDIRTLLSLPNAAGQYSDFDTAVPAGTHYTTYDECPSDDADYVQQAGKTAVRDTANLQDCSTIGIVAADTLQAVNVLARIADNTTGGITVRDNATDYDYIKAAGKTAAWFSQYFAVMPNDSAAWSQARFNAFQAGALSSGGTVDSFLYALMVMVAYIPVAPSAGIYYNLSKGIFTQIADSNKAMYYDVARGLMTSLATGNKTLDIDKNTGRFTAT